jgi:hypothetical protein
MILAVGLAFSIPDSFHLAIFQRLRSQPWRPVPFALVFAGAFAWLVAAERSGVDRTSALVQALAQSGLAATDITWLDEPPRHVLGAFTGSARAIVRAAKPGEPADLFLARARLTPEGNLFRLCGVWNLTRTPLADESAPLVDGDLALYTTAVEGVTTSVFAFELDKAQAPRSDDLTRTMQAQIALTNYQETGQWAGISRRGWSLDPSPSSVRLSVGHDAIEVDADDRVIRLARDGSEVLEGAGFVRAHPTALSRPGNLVTWAVDRVRAMSWFGDDRMQQLKAAAFTMEDLLSRWGGTLLGDSSAKDIASDLGEAAPAAAATYTDPDTGWPPPPMEPLITPALPGEGAWVPLDHDAFVVTNPGAPPAFMTSFIRTDRERLYTRVYVGLWDPRQIEMHMMAGTIEPIGASGETGPGLIPRTPEVMRRVVAAMNGGFQAMHGEFGMMGNGVEYLPPKPYAATVAELRDGSTAFGEWPASEQVPDTILSYRQNLTALVKDEKFNPYGRTWWGGTPPGQTDKIHTVRSGICLTRERFIGYFYGQEIAADVLAQAMIRARCKFGIHLDMNAGHTGLEFYRVAPAQELAPLGRPLSPEWEAEGPVPGFDGWKFRGRRMIRHMGLMNFPRYIHREARDFFYLTLRPILPGPDVPSPSADEGHWRTRGLPQHGFPFALATTTVHPDSNRADFRIDLLKVDPHLVGALGSPGVDSSAPTVVVFNNVARSGQGRPRLWLGDGTVTIESEPAEGALELMSGLAANEAASHNASAAIGITDEDGMLVYAEASSAEGAASTIDALLAQLGCSRRMMLLHPLAPALGGTTMLDGTAARPTDAATVRLVRREAKGAATIFDDTPIVPPDVWMPLQARRVRYFRKPTPVAPAVTAPRPPGPANGGASGSSNTRENTAPEPPSSPGPINPFEPN